MPRPKKRVSKVVVESSSSSSSSDDDDSASSNSSGARITTARKHHQQQQQQHDIDDNDTDITYDPLADNLDTLIDSVVDYEHPSELWDYVRQWLQTHSIDETKLAVEAKGDFDTSALHVACRNHPPVDVIEVMLMAAPDIIFWADSFGWLPLHYACANGADITVITLLVNAFPDSRLNTDKRGRTPLHFALGNVTNLATPSLVKLLTGKKGESTRWPDENEMLPIHYACAYGANVSVLTVLTDSWAESVRKTDNKGRTPLHFMMGNADREHSPQVVELLLQLYPDAMETLDSEKNLPLHLLSTKAETIKEEQTEERDRMCKCLLSYLNAKPCMSSEFINGLRAMSEWLRDVAVLHPTVQTMLNQKMSSRFPTMILLLDFYFLCAIIAAFSFASAQSIDRRFNILNDTTESKQVSVALLSPLYIGALYFIMREILQLISVGNHMTIFAYLLDAENLVNFVFILLVVYYTVLMQTGLGDAEHFRIGAAFALGTCYLQMLAYLKSILIEFAVFVSGVTYVTSKLVAFIVSLIITLVAFAQMWYTLFKNSSECLVYNEERMADMANGLSPSSAPSEPVYYDETMPGLYDSYQECEPEIDYPYCQGLWWSMLKTYTMFLGEYDSSLFKRDNFNTFLFVSFYFIEVIILVNILIAIITDLYGVVTNDRASIVFWSNRLSFLTDMDMITNGPWKQARKEFFSMGGGRSNDDDNEDEELSRLVKRQNVDISWERIGWKKLIECFDPEMESGMGAIIYVPLRIFVSMVLIPLWLFMGILSAGWLWPPQIREGLFVQKISKLEDTNGENEIEKRIGEVDNLMKDLSSLHEGLLHETMADRNDMIALKKRVTGIRKELKKEMKSIKGVMTKLFEVQQKAMTQ
jgi:hypothetical protein